MKRILGLSCFLLVGIAPPGQSQGVNCNVSQYSGGEGCISCETVVSVAASAVWKAISTREGLSAWAARDALVELKINGLYELYFFPEKEPGKRGMEGNTILSYLPEKMLSYKGGMPNTWTVWTLDSRGDSTVVTFSAIGVGEEWTSQLPHYQNALADYVKGLKAYLEGAAEPQFEYEKAKKKSGDG